MICILCSNYDEAKEFFEIFLEFLQENEPGSIKKVYYECSCVETDDDLRYIFVDYRFENLFVNMKADIIDVEDFLYGIDEYYEREVLI